MNSKPKIVFVSSFKKNADGSTGGWAHDSKTLIESEISNHYDWVNLDTTADSVIHVSFIKRLYKAFKRIFTFLNIIRKRDVKVAFILTAHAFSFYEKGIMVFLASMFGKKSFLFPRSGFAIDDLKTGWKRRYYKSVFKKSTFVVCQGENWKKTFGDLYPKDPSRFIVVKNWFNINDFQFPEKTPSQKVELLFLGWVDRNKGVFDLVDAINNLDESIPSFNVNICGGGVDFDSVQQKVKELGLDSKFTFHGWVKGDKKNQQLGNADIFVLPSYAEGLPNSMLEAMLAKAAVVVSDVGSIPEVINTGENGFMYHKGDVNALKDALEQLILNEQLRQKVSLNGYETVVKQHNITNVEKYLLSLMKD
jgi:glycosyltransferase involved in cell wall biosynthesis